MNNDNLENISKGLNEVMLNMMVKCMLNPENKDFYIGTLTLHKVSELFKRADADIPEIFWAAYSIAENAHAEQQRKHKTLYEEFYEDTTTANNVCPECDCPNFVPGVKCPNCDYVD